jgi:hypothetical protein
VKPNENPFKIAGANKLISFFSPDVVLKMDVPGWTRTLDSADEIGRPSPRRASLQEGRIGQRGRVSGRRLAIGDRASQPLPISTAAETHRAGPVAVRKIDRRWRISRSRGGQDPRHAASVCDGSGSHPYLVAGSRLVAQTASLPYRRMPSRGTAPKDGRLKHEKALPICTRNDQQIGNLRYASPHAAILAAASI